MAASPVGFWQRRGFISIFEVLHSWWRHRVSFLVSLVITISALALYYVVFLQEKKTPLSEFVQRLELDALDTRFRYRPRAATHPDPRIVLVVIDQHSQEILGRWPFSRTYFATMLDVLHDDGAKVAAFDITFSKPQTDPNASSLQSLGAVLEARQKAGHAIDPVIFSEVRKLAAASDADKHFSDSIRRFGPVILGNFFLYTDADLRGIDAATLDAYADQLGFFAFPQVIGTRQGSQKEDRIHLIQEFAGAGLTPKGAESNIPALTSALGGDAAWTGFFNAPPDADGVVRRSTLVLPYGRSHNFEEWDLYGSLDVMTARAFLGARSDQTILTYGPIGITDIQLGSDLRIRPDGRGQLMINYQGPTGTFAHFSIADVVSRNFAPGTFRDRIVLVGATATGIGDLRATPYGGTDYPGVEIHANVLDNILNQRFLKRDAKQALTDALLIVIFGIPLGIWMALVAPRWMLLGLSLLAPLVAVDYFAFLHGWWLNFSVPAITLTSNVLLVSLYRALVEEKEKRRVRTAFGQYLSPEVIRRLLVNPQLVEPRKTDITVMFSDIRGFTTISEKLDAQDLALFLNQYLSDMTRLVFDHHGTLDKYIGDAVMAFWGAPFEEADHAAKACHTALQMMQRVRDMQKKWEAEGKPHLDIGIGLNTGVASVGNMGSALRYGYTALGDTVNLSSRLEGLNKDYGTHIIVNETTYNVAKNAHFLFRELDLIRVKGKLQPVTIHELIGRQDEATVYGSPEEVRLRIDLFLRGRTFYSARQWEAAQQTFQAILDRWPDDGPSRTYWKRCQEYLFDEPPLAWDGVFTMTHK
ncbi:MAG TPA: adenylate/guanylate cyclase domain-containing protein [Candidatus Dormibacteraeota bacterium]|nr:adenylate/guanylate cyclase domain-containing protein [Candidatus Dormibacteraeota bacterium]